MNSDETYMTPEDEELDLEALVEFADNPEPRCACVLLLDASGSMYGDPIDALNQGVATYIDTLQGDALASLRVETAIVSFNSEVELVQDFAAAEDVSPVSLKAWGEASVAAAVNYALDLVVERASVLNREAGIVGDRPLVILITGGTSTDSYADMRDASRRVSQAHDAREAVCFCVGVEGAVGVEGDLKKELYAFELGFVRTLDADDFTEMLNWDLSGIMEPGPVPDFPSHWAEL